MAATPKVKPATQIQTNLLVKVHYSVLRLPENIYFLNKTGCTGL